MEDFSIKTCSNCGSTKFKTWQELTEDEKIVIGKLPQNTEFSNEQRKSHRFCKRCLYEIPDENFKT